MIGNHNVVFAHMPGIGSNSAATVAAGLRSSFRGIEVAFVVGLCGVVPMHVQTGEEIVLGDCIVSTAVVQYDFGRQYPHGFVRKDSIEDSLNQSTFKRAGTEIRSLTSMLATSRNKEQLTERLAYHLKVLQKERSDVNYPGQQRDRLFQPSYIHQHYHQKNCEVCLRGAEICSQDCDFMGCENEQLIKRQRFQTLQTASLVSNSSSPRIFFGRFGSGNTVMRSGLDRDRIAKRDGLIAFEMEGSGVWDSLPTVVIKSACDYADSHKTKEWQPYAAATAAAGLKALLERWEVTDEVSNQDGRPLRLNMEPDSSSVKYHIPFTIRGLPVTKKFINRPVEMQFLEEELLPKANDNRRQTFVLRGLGGIGKTQLAIEFMRRHHEKSSAVLWLDGNSEESLKQSLVRYADMIPHQGSAISRTNVPRGEDEIETIVQEVLDWLAAAENHTWLLCFDNVDRELDHSKSDPLAYNIEEYLPDADHGSILITTRITPMEQLGESLEVKKVDMETAQAILDNLYKRPCDTRNSKQLLEHLDGLPLAIAQAGAYLQESGINMKTYLRLYEEKWKDIIQMQHRNAPLRDYPNRSVLTTWNISYDSILTQDKHAACLLILWSFLDCRNIWFDIFKEAISVSLIREALSHWLGNIAKQEMSFIEAMQLLRRYSLIEESEQTDSYSMHAVVHRWAYLCHGINYYTTLGGLALAVLGHAVPMISERDYATVQRRLLPHIQECTDKMHGIPTEVMSQVEVTLTPDCTDTFTNSSEQEEAVLNAYHKFGILYAGQGKLDMAERLYTWALQEKGRVLGAKHYSTLKTLNNLGVLYLHRGRLEDSESMFMQALNGYEEALGSKHASTLAIVHNLGLLYNAKNELGKAEEMYVRAWRGFEETVGSGDLETLRSINNLGNLYCKQGKVEEAEKLHNQVLRGREEKLGANHPSILDAMVNLALDYSSQGKHEEEQEMYVRA